METSDSGQLVTADADSLFVALPEQVQEIVLSGRKVLQSGAKTNVLTQWRVGDLLNKLDAHVDSKDKAALDELITQVCTCWGYRDINLTSMYNLRSVARTFTLSFVKEQLDEPLRNGQLITWSHLLELQKIQDPARVEQLLEQIRENSWSSKELRLQMSGGSESSVKRAGGRKPSVPTSPVAIVTKITKSVQQTSNYMREVMEPIDSLIGEGFDYDDNLIEQITAAIDQLKDFHKDATEMLARLKKMSSIAGKVVKGDKKAKANA